MLMHQYGTRFTAAAFYSVDSYEHLFSQFRGGGERFSNTVDEGYRRTDRRLGQFLEDIGSDKNVVIISDHGFDFVNHHHVFAPPGLIFGISPAFDRGRRVDSLSIYDIAPLILRLMNLPLADDLEATARGTYREALGVDFLDQYPDAQHIPTYESTLRRSTSGVESPIDEEMTDVLRGLGYLD